MVLTEKSKKRAPRNRTITLTEPELELYRSRLIRLSKPAMLQDIVDRTICQDVFDLIEWLPEHSVDLLFADPITYLNLSIISRLTQCLYPNTNNGWNLGWEGL